MVARLMVLDTGDYWEPEPFQVAVLDALCRGVDRVWLEIPEGNAKTTLAAAIGLIHIYLVPMAEVPVAAASRDQTGVLLRQATGIVRRSPGFDSRFRRLEGYRRVECPGSGGRLQVFAADAGTGDGVIPTLPILEELHRHPSLDLLRTWNGKLYKRNGQSLIISTAGEPGGPYELAKEAALLECAEHGEVIREGMLTVARMPGFEMRIHALSPTDDVEDLDLVEQANPLSTVTREVLQAKRSDPTWNRQHWARFTCGVPMRDTSSAISDAEWDELGREEISDGTIVDVGADFGWKFDTTAITPLWMPEPTRRVLGRPEIIVPPMDGTSTEPSEVREAFIRIHRRTPIRRVAMDASMGGAQIAEWLEKPPGEMDDPDHPGEMIPDYDLDRGFGLGVEVVEVSAGNVVQCRAYDLFMEAIREGWLRHPGDPDLTRHVLNAVAKQVTHDRYRFDRPSTSRAAKHQDRRVIDALIAASNVHWHLAAGLGEDDERPFDPADYRIEVL
jgi:phage terminase large subunit-like protein